MTEAESLEFVGANEVRLRGRTLTYFSGCDYFRLARDPRLARAAMASLKQNGLNVAASRRTTGNHKIYGQLEGELAAFFEADSAVVVPDGYFAPIAVAQALAGEVTHAFGDELAHGAVLDAARMLACPVKRFKHRQVGDVAKLIAKCGPQARPLVMTDGMFAHDGSVAPLREYLKALPTRTTFLVDDAHGVGVLGASGRGALEHEGVGRQRIIQCATLSKAFGAYGGVVLGSADLREKIMTKAWAFMGTTPLPPPMAGAALMALKIMRREPVRHKRLYKNLAYARSQLQAGGWEIASTPGPIVRLPALDEMAAMDLKARLLKAGIYPPFLKYGNASAGGVFRFVLSSEHSRSQLDKMIAVLVKFKTQQP